MTGPLNQDEIVDVKDLLRLRRDGIIAGHNAGNRAECKLTTGEIFDEVKGQCLPNGMYNDPCGLGLPLAVAHIDRIKSSRPYERGNLRLYPRGLQLPEAQLRRRLATDQVPQKPRRQFRRLVEALLAAGVEPLVASTFFGNCKNKGWHRSAYTEVYQLLDFSSLFTDDNEEGEDESKRQRSPRLVLLPAPPETSQQPPCSLLPCRIETPLISCAVHIMY